MFDRSMRPDGAVDVPSRAPRRERTTTVESLLVMLNLCPRSGYQLRLAIARTIGNFWQESFGQIYPALRKMVKDGLVVCTEEPGKRESKVYRLTDAGRERLREWLALPCERQVARDELLLKLFSGAQAPRGSLQRHVREFRDRVSQDLERYRMVEKILPQEQKENPGLPYFMLTLRQGLLKADALLKWSDETLAELERLDAQRETKRMDERSGTEEHEIANVAES